MVQRLTNCFDRTIMKHSSTGYLLQYVFTSGIVVVEVADSVVTSFVVVGISVLDVGAAVVVVVVVVTVVASAVVVGGSVVDGTVEMRV